VSQSLLANYPAVGPVFQREELGRVLLLVPHSRLGSLFEAEIDKEACELLEMINQVKGLSIVIDLGDSDYLGTAMLGAVVRLWKRISQRGGRLALCRISGPVHDTLRITKLHAVWPIFDTREAALDALRG
jgi:anti-sigma B factor antagonist